MKNITLSLTDELIDFLDTIDNKSEYVRIAIDDKRGKSEKSIQELEIQVNNDKAKLVNSELELNTKIEQVLSHKQDLKLSEIKDIEDIMIRKTREQQEFMEKWTPILSQYEQIRNFDFIEGWESVANLTPILDKLRKDNIRVGIVQLRDYLSFKPITSTIELV